MALEICTGRRSLVPRIIIYGEPKVGKTMWAAGAPEPLMISGEAGDDNIDANRVVFDKKTKRTHPRTWDEYTEKLLEVRDEKSLAVKTLVIDGFTAIEQLCAAEICKRNNWKGIAGPGYGKGESALFQAMRESHKIVEDIRERGIGIIFVCHSTLAKAPNTESADEYKRHAPALNNYNTADFCGFLVGWCDAVLFARKEIVIAKGTEGSKKTFGISTGSHILHTRGEAGFVGGCRWGNVDPKLPLDAASFWAQVDEGTSVDRMRSRVEKLAAASDAETLANVKAFLEKDPRSKTLDALTRAVDSLRSMAA